MNRLPRAHPRPMKADPEKKASKAIITGDKAREAMPAPAPAARLSRERAAASGIASPGVRA